MSCGLERVYGIVCLLSGTNTSKQEIGKMNPFLAKNQPKQEYTPLTDAAQEYNRRRIAIDFRPNTYEVYRDSAMHPERNIVESGLICPEVASDDCSRAARKIRGDWINDLIERIRKIAIDEKLAFSVAQGFSSIVYADYR